MAASSSNIIPNPADPNNPIILVNLSQCRILTPNLSLWSSQITSILFGLDLLKYIDRTYPLPPAQTKVNNVDQPNPAHNIWKRQDSLLLGAILCTLDNTVAPLVHQAKTSSNAWKILKTTCANPSRDHLLQIKSQLDHLTKSNQTISDYMQAIKNCTDKLALMGKPMDLEDIIAKILKGLDYNSYKPVIDSIRA